MRGSKVTKDELGLSVHAFHQRLTALTCAIYMNIVTKEDINDEVRGPRLKVASRQEVAEVICVIARVPAGAKVTGLAASLWTLHFTIGLTLVVKVEVVVRLTRGH